ncbi:uncharacterized protein C8Q71DRAFT_853148 [Rhodofomes roseus]|uniref:Uncharacterized protein n=1 Tax=Rhodofomes roseus TaxID=34475 RepID=A0A4Y9XW73_9APHY|nr:uncharacterized protein C8Q71DRAFT_853148 [Rhodofomes roseus]KAH9842606.1 hypothetical protein C8Q71DRAFT_853148 [Rhodofomes roseus]TFY53391.1 hypothetical protein EVJ58_g9476 [Rhodofomes roseus]
MATFYSSFFSSGLLAPMPHETSGSSSPTTPRASQSNLPGADPFSLQIDTTPTANDFPAAPRSANDILQSRPRSDSQGSGRPGLRRRRSSVTIAASPVNPMKSNGVPRSARNSYMAARARSGSESRSQEKPEGTTVAGRTRSGSLGGQMIRNARRMSRKLAPPLPAPPPTAPLPAPPSSRSDIEAVTPRSATLPLPIPIISMTQPPSTPRRPLARRAQTTDNVSLLSTPSSFLSSCMTPADEEAGMNFGLSADGGMPSSPVYSEPAMCERLGMQVDYPSPIDGPGFVWERPGEAMKEN